MPERPRAERPGAEDPGASRLVVYALLAVRSYTQPLIIMGAIPFGIVGAMIGHMLLGHDLSLVSLMGVIALSGVVLNDSLIMIDHANRNRGDGSAFGVIFRRQRRQRCHWSIF